MDRIEGLREFIRSEEYRNALGLPREVTEEYSILAQGEYNVNYRFTHPLSGRRLLLRVNCGSQMHLTDQIGYEYRALKMLEATGRTPRAFYADGSKKYLDHGVLVMEELPGHALDYKQDMDKAAAILADIHSMPVPDDMIPEEGDDSGLCALVSPPDPLKAILEECEQMVSVYMDSPLGDAGTRRAVRKLLDKAWQFRESAGGSDIPVPYRCCINTELNSTNFLINSAADACGDTCDHLIDWEKPLYGDPAQDLGHFLAPTTTFWKTDVVLGREEMEDFVRQYIRCVDGRYDTSGLEDRTRLFMTITCLRGITWCAMAWVEYREPGRLLTNESTMRKLDQYLDPEFLRYIAGYYE
jgi:aminoglycoside phosphotransferase (APT) family kinase protein